MVVREFNENTSLIDEYFNIDGATMRGTPAMNGDKQPTDSYQTKNPKHLTCPITQQLFLEAVETDCGHRFSLKALEKHMNTGGNTCPCCKTPISPWEITAQPELNKEVFSFAYNKIGKLVEDGKQLDEVALFLEAASILGVEACDSMQSEGLNINAKDKDGRTALAIAVYEGNTIAASTLLKSGADTSWSDQEGSDLLMIATANEDTTMCNALLNNGFTGNRRDYLGKTAFLQCMEKNDHKTSAIQLVRLFMSHKQDPLCTDSRGKNAFDYAVQYHSVAICEEMLTQGNKALKRYAKDCLMDAIMRNDIIKVKHLLAAGTIDSEQDTELFRLASRADTEPLEALILELLMEACPEELSQVLTLQKSHTISTKLSDARRIYLDMAYLFFLKFDSNIPVDTMNEASSFNIWRENHLRYFPLNLAIQKRVILQTTLKRAENFQHDTGAIFSRPDWGHNWIAAIKYYILLAFKWLLARKTQALDQATSSFKAYIKNPSITGLNQLKSYTDVLSASKFGRQVIAPYILMMNYSMKRKSSTHTSHDLFNTWLSHEERRLTPKTPISHQA